MAEHLEKASGRRGRIDAYAQIPDMIASIEFATMASEVA